VAKTWLQQTVSSGSGGLNQGSAVEEWDLGYLGTSTLLRTRGFVSVCYQADNGYGPGFGAGLPLLYLRVATPTASNPLPSGWPSLGVDNDDVLFAQVQLTMTGYTPVDVAFGRSENFVAYGSLIPGQDDSHAMRHFPVDEDPAPTTFWALVEDGFTGDPVASNPFAWIMSIRQLWENTFFTAP